MGSSAPSVNMNMAGMNMNMNMNMNPMSGMSMSGIGAACGMATENKTCSVQFPLHAQRRKRRVLFTQAQVGTSLLSVGAPSATPDWPQQQMLHDVVGQPPTDSQRHSTNRSVHLCD